MFKMLELQEWNNIHERERERQRWRGDTARNQMLKANGTITNKS